MTPETPTPETLAELRIYAVAVIHKTLSWVAGVSDAGYIKPSEGSYDAILAAAPPPKSLLAAAEREAAMREVVDAARECIAEHDRRGYQPDHMPPLRAALDRLDAKGATP